MAFREPRVNAGSFIDPVETWKQIALERARLEEEELAGRPFLRWRVRRGFAVVLVLSQLLSLPFGLIGPASTVFVLPSVLLARELPRALVARVLGRSSKIVLSAAGGRTELFGAPLSGFAATAFATAGCIANLLFAIVLAVLSQYVRGGAFELLQVLIYCHALWGVGQLLPVLPFRAGVAIARRLRHGPRVAHAASSLVLASALGALGSSSTWGSRLFPILALAILACGRALVEAYWATRDDLSGAVVTARQAEAHLFQDDTQRAIELARQGITLARSTHLRNRLYRTLAWGAIGKQDPILAHEALERLPSSAIDLHLIAAYSSCCNRLDDAAKLLEDARGQGHRTAETTKLFIDVLFRSGKESAAFSLARAERQLLSPEEWRAIEAAGHYRNAGDRGHVSHTSAGG